MQNSKCVMFIVETMKFNRYLSLHECSYFTMKKFPINSFYALIIICNILLDTISTGEKNNLTDVRKCRVTHAGTEYIGPLSKTLSGIRCQLWDTKHPLHEMSKSIVDEQFPDGSKSLAKNRCRNPGKEHDEPWCYTLSKDVIDDFCDVPLCIYHECRLTGPGVEYAGKLKRSASERECLSWNKRYREKGKRKVGKFPNSAFPERSRKKAKHRCRNPDGDPGGPWCFVESPEKEYEQNEEEEEGKNDDKESEEGDEEEEDEDVVERDYCEIPFCDEQDCMVYTTRESGQVVHSHWTHLNNTYRNISVAVKLWNPEDWQHVQLYLALAVLSVPATGLQLQEWRAGVELTLSNRKSGITAGAKNASLVGSPVLVWGSRWTKLWIRWGGGYISMGQEGVSKPLIIQEYNENDGLLGLDPGAFNYYSIVGEGGMWSFPFCDIDCEVHTTTRLDFVRFWPLKRTTTTHDATFFVRATHSAYLELRVSPTIKYPNIWLMMRGRKNMTQVIFQRTSKTKRVMLQQVKADTLLSYWEWKEFSISVFGDSLSVFWTRDVGTQTLIEVEHEVIRRMRWISPGSLSTAHWTILCAPTEAEQVYPALPPECSLSDKEVRYKGSQWTTATGLPCLPWIYTTTIINVLRNDSLFEDGSIAAALNYCRNPINDPEGPFCYVEDKATINPEYCRPRKCRSAECRMAGTGNDYIGELNVTRSNRVCQRWMSSTPHQVKPAYRNETLFPELSASKARNYCRDPSRNIAGSWCYTTDPLVMQDVCDVRDCVKPEECIMMTRGVGEGRLVYILNKWRKEGIKFWLKEWDPDLTDGIIFIFRPLEDKNYYKLIIGAKNNEKVELFYGTGDDKKEILLKEKTLPHLIPIGKWGGFWVKVPQGRISLGYEGLDNYLFDWEHGNVSLTPEQKHEIFKPMFFTYTSVKGHTIGVNFPCDECHTEKTSTFHYTKILPLGLWSRQPGSHYNNLTLYIRGTGVAVIPLIKLPGLGSYYGLTIGDAGNRMYFIWQSGDTIKTVTKTRIKGPMIYKDMWTVFFISYNETHFSVKRNGDLLLQWRQDEPMLFYWFSVGAEDGEITWSANCEPADIDGSPRNGGWSEWSSWTCSVTCGGGEGIQTRTCTNPVPNVYGEDCIGSSKLEGDCNNFKCGQISPDTVEYLRNLLEREHKSIKALERDYVELICHQEAMDRIMSEAPTAQITWSLNGKNVSPDGVRILMQDNNLVINEAKPENSGVYICLLTEESGSHNIISVTALAVKPETSTISVRATRQLTLYCHSHVLGYVYKDLIQKWELNDVLWKDYGITTLEAVNTEQMAHANYSHAGEWKCIVLQPDLNFKWTTNWILVEGRINEGDTQYIFIACTEGTVKHAPTFLTYLMEDPLPAHLFKHFGSETLVLVFLISVLLVVIIAAAFYVYLRWRRL